MNGIIVPTHPKDFHWTEQLLKSAGPEENIILIFSSEEDYQQFKLPCNYIIVPPKPNHIESVATYKKLEALSQLYDKYDYLATMDTEAIFLKPVTPHLESIWENNCLVGNSTEHGVIFIESCLRDVNINYPLPTNTYYWFNEIQVYPTNLIPEFMKWLPQFIHDCSFDYLLFTIFMITNNNHKLRILNGHSYQGIIEDLGMDRYSHNRHFAAEVNWSTWFPGVEKLDNIKILFHLDRFPIQGDL